MDLGFRLFLFLCVLVENRISVTGADSSLQPGASMFFYQDRMYPKDCQEVQDQCSSQNATGAHLIRPDGYNEPFWVYCAGEWTVFQRRQNWHLDFNRNWTEYRDGFGYLNVEFWLGVEKLAQLTNQKRYELRIELETTSGTKVHLSYDQFRINDEFSDYSLVSLGRQNGSARLDLTQTTPENDKLRDCYDIWKKWNRMNSSGDYTVTPSGWNDAGFTVNCNMTVDGGGWTVIQRRIQSSSRLDFDKTWRDYQVGFGSPSGEFWIGNEKMFYLTNQKDYELRVDMVQYSSSRQFYAKYDFFRINGVSDKYRMIGLGNHTGTAEFDALRNQHHMQFSTPDQDNDLHPSNHCADRANAGWWYYSCDYVNLNRNYDRNHLGVWYHLPGSGDLRYTEMKIRPKEAN